jgi:hypothetical protein
VFAAPGLFCTCPLLPFSSPCRAGPGCCPFFCCGGRPRPLHSLLSPPGAPLVEYLGEILSSSEVESRYPVGDVGVYCLGLSSSLFIDAALFRGVGASANASGKGVRPNARFVVSPQTRSARIEVTRSVRAGGEIFVSYGAEYWKDAHTISHSTSDIPEWEWDLSDPFACPSPSSVGPLLVSSGAGPLSVGPAASDAVGPGVPPLSSGCVPAPGGVCVCPGPVLAPAVPPVALATLRAVAETFPPPPSYCEVHLSAPRFPAAWSVSPASSSALLTLLPAVGSASSVALFVSRYFVLITCTVRAQGREQRK